MKRLQEFKIAFIGLTNKTHFFEYKIDKSFFESFENNTIEDCEIAVEIAFDKKESFFHLQFQIDGTFHTSCDRCLEKFDKEIFGDYDLYVKFSGNEQSSEDEDVIYISPSDDFLDISKPIYDYTLLSIPLSCIHPDDEAGNSTCNSSFLEKLEGQKEEKQTVDPRWSALLDLKNKKK